MTGYSLIDPDPATGDFPSVTDEFVRAMLAPPRKGIPAAELTDREKLVIAMSACVPVDFKLEGNHLVMFSRVLFGVADDGRGGYIVGSRQA